MKKAIVVLFLAVSMAILPLKLAAEINDENLEEVDIVIIEADQGGEVANQEDEALEQSEEESDLEEDTGWKSDSAGTEEDPAGEELVMEPAEEPVAEPLSGMAIAFPTTLGMEITVTDQDELYQAMKEAEPGETILIGDDFTVSKELYFEKDIDVILASSTGNAAVIKTKKPTPPDNYPFNFNGGNVNLAFQNVIIEGDGTHVLVRFQNGVKDVTRNLTGGVFRNGYRSGNGGALFVENGNIRVIDCVFENNKAARGAALYLGNNVAAGGNGNAVIERCVFRNNIATSWEGGAVSIRNDYDPEKGNAEVIGSIFERNTAEGGSGGALSVGGNLFITGCTFNHNTAVTGGAIVSNGRICDINSTLITGNRATNNGVGNSGSVGGGGILASGSLIIKNSEISGNTTDNTNGGGIFCPSYTKELYDWYLAKYPEYAELVAFKPAEISIENCMITGNSAPKGDGGGIYTPIENLAYVTVDAATVFSDNKAATWVEVPYEKHPDRELHKTNVLTGMYSNSETGDSFTIAYNNYDICYNAEMKKILIRYVDENGKILFEEDKYVRLGSSLVYPKETITDDEGREWKSVSGDPREIFVDDDTLEMVVEFLCELNFIPGTDTGTPYLADSDSGYSPVTFTEPQGVSGQQTGGAAPTVTAAAGEPEPVGIELPANEIPLGAANVGEAPNPADLTEVEREDEEYTIGSDILPLGVLEKLDEEKTNPKTSGQTDAFIWYSLLPAGLAILAKYKR